MYTAVLESPSLSGVGSGTTAESPAEKAAATEDIRLPAELLDGGEVVILALRPSPWFVVFDSLHWLVAGVVVLGGAALAGRPMGLVSYSALIQWTMLVVAFRLGVALLRWVSRFYVLTNRRVLRISGALRSDVLDIALIDVINTRVTISAPERLLGLGTIRFAWAQPTDAAWNHVSKPDEVHTAIRRAIERAIDCAHGS